MKSIIRKMAVVAVVGAICSSLWADTVSLNFREADIRAVIESAAEITGRSFVLDPRVKGNITIIAPGEIEADLFYEAILSALQVQGFQAVDDGAVTRVIPFSTSFQIPSGLVGGELQTKVISLNHVTAAELLPVLKPMMSKGSLMQAHPAGNNLVVTDIASSIQQIEAVLRDIDSPDNSAVDVVALSHISAGEALHIANQLKQFQDQQLSIVEDSFNNRVIVSGSRTGRAAFRRFIAELDVPTTQQGGVEVIYLNYSSAEEIKPILDGMLASETFLKLAGEGGEEGAQSSFSIEADTDNNAIVIAASASVIGEVQNVIRKLDRRRPQVLIEAIIANVSEDVARDISSQLAAAGPNSGGLLTSFDGLLTSLLGLAASVDSDTTSTTVTDISTGNTTTTTNSSDNSQAFNTALSGVNNGITGVFGDFDSDSGEGWGLLIQALASDSKTNILSTPSVLTLDNEEASLSVGQEVPFVTGSFTSAADNSTNPFQTIEREEVGVVLTVTPQINDANAVRLQISQEISSISDAVTAGVSDIVTDKSTITTNVMVEDQQLLILGGLMQDSERDSEVKIPLLGDIPLLGWLFRDDSNSARQSVLMMFIRPTILRTVEDAEAISAAKYDYLKEYKMLDREDEDINMSEDIFEIFDLESDQE